MKFNFTKTFLLSLLLICLSLSYKVTLKNFLNSNKEISIPGSMMTLVSKEKNEAFPSPKKQAFKFLNFLYDMEAYNCMIGVNLSDTIKNIDLNFLERFKPIEESSTQDINRNIVLLDNSLKEIIKALNILENSNCVQVIRDNSRKFRKSLFLMTIKYLKYLH